MVNTGSGKMIILIYNVKKINNTILINQSCRYIAIKLSVRAERTKRCHFIKCCYWIISSIFRHDCKASEQQRCPSNTWAECTVYYAQLSNLDTFNVGIANTVWICCKSEFLRA